MTSDISSARIAIVHPFLLSQGGGEKVIHAFARLFPQAMFFTMLLEIARERRTGASATAAHSRPRGGTGSGLDFPA